MTMDPDMALGRGSDLDVIIALGDSAGQSDKHGPLSSTATNTDMGIGGSPDPGLPCDLW